MTFEISSASTVELHVALLGPSSRLELDRSGLRHIGFVPIYR